MDRKRGQMSQSQDERLLQKQQDPGSDFLNLAVTEGKEIEQESLTDDFDHWSPYSL